MDIQRLLILASSSLIVKEIVKFRVKIPPPHVSNLESALPRAFQEVLGFESYSHCNQRNCGFWMLDKNLGNECAF